MAAHDDGVCKGFTQKYISAQLHCVGYTLPEWPNDAS